MLTSLTRYEDWWKIGGVCVVVPYDCFQKSSLPSIMGVSGQLRYLCDSIDHINNIDALKQGQQPCSYRVMAGRSEPFFTMVVSF